MDHQKLTCAQNYEHAFCSLSIHTPAFKIVSDLITRFFSGFQIILYLSAMSGNNT